MHRSSIFQSGRIYNSGDSVVAGVFEQLTVRSSSDIDTFMPVSASAFNVNSSKRYKENIRHMAEEEANKLDNIEVVIYDYKKKENGTNQVGVIAENAYKVLPNVVTLTEINGKMVPDSVDYSKFVGYLIKRDQMKSKRIKEQDERIDRLENEVLELKNLINSFKK